MLTDEQISQAAQALYDAEIKNEPTTPTSEAFPEADIEDAYRISQSVTDMKLKAGRIIKGHKIGLTSKAMRSLTGATEPDYGTMFDDWFVLEASTVSRERMNRPLVEVEIAFVLKAGSPRPRGQRGGCDPRHRLRVAVHRDRRQPPEGPRPEHARRQHLRRRVVRARGARRPPDPPPRCRPAAHRGEPRDQRHRGRERRRPGGHGQSHQLDRLARQQAARIRHRARSGPRAALGFVHQGDPVPVRRLSRRAVRHTGRGHLQSRSR